MCLCLVLHRSLCLYISLSLSPITLSPALSCSPTLDLSCSLLRHLCSYLPMSIKCSLLSSLLRDARSQTGDYSGFCILASIRGPWTLQYAITHLSFFSNESVFSSSMFYFLSFSRSPSLSVFCSAVSCQQERKMITVTTVAMSPTSYGQVVKH